MLNKEENRGIRVNKHLLLDRSMGRGTSPTVYATNIVCVECNKYITTSTHV